MKNPNTPGNKILVADNSAMGRSLLGASTSDALAAARKKYLDLPNTEQLAMLAATLARNVTDEPKPLAKSAMALWLAAREESESRKMMAKPEQDYEPGITTISMTRDNFVKTMLPQIKGRSADVARIAKAYVRHNLLQATRTEPTQDQINAAYADWKTVLCSDEPGSGPRGIHFMEWHRQYVGAFRRVAGSAKKTKRTKKKRKARPPMAKLKAALAEREKNLKLPS